MKTMGLAHCLHQWQRGFTQFKNACGGLSGLCKFWRFNSKRWLNSRGLLCSCRNFSIFYSTLHRKSEKLLIKRKIKRTEQSAWVDTVPWVETVASRMAQKRSSNRKPQVKFGPCDSPWERPCFNSGTLLCLHHSYLQLISLLSWTNHENERLQEVLTFKASNGVESFGTGASFEAGASAYSSSCKTW